MNAFRTSLAAFCVCLIALPLQSEAQNEVIPNRDASFLPLESVAPYGNAPLIAPETASAPPMSLAPTASPSQPQQPQAKAGSVEVPVTPMMPVTQQPSTSLQPSIPPQSVKTETPPGAATATTASVVLPPPTVVSAPEILAKPVESGAIRDIDLDSIGLLASEEGGLGNAMWKGTPRELVERLLPSLTLPAASPVLNGLARRLLLTIASVPSGESSSNRTLTAMRVEKLVMLGDAKDAWRLAMMTKPDRIDEITLRLAAEAALVSDAGKDVCDKLPDIMKMDNSPEWQKSLIVCQIRAGDTKAAQLGLEVMRTQSIKDDIFLSLVDKNILSGSKVLPRQLTPLRPLTLALLRIIDQPITGEVYGRPEAALIPELLLLKTKEDNGRLQLAERAGDRGLLTGAQIEAVYQSIVFAPENLSGALNAADTGGRLHALLYQAALQEKTPQSRVDYVNKFLHSLGAPALNGALGQVLADMAKDIPITSDNNNFAPSALRIFILAGKPEQALAWLKQAQSAAASSPDIAKELQIIWPLTVLSGLVPDNDYGQSFGKWLEAELREADRTKREQIGSVLLLFDSAGYAVPEEAWAHVVDVSVNDKKQVIPSSALLLERLHAAGTANRRGEAVLLGLLVADGGIGEPPFFALADTVRALRLVGLSADAQALARELAAVLLAPPQGL